MSYTKPTVGQPFSQGLSARLWSDIIDVVRDYKAGKLSNRNSSPISGISKLFANNKHIDGMGVGSVATLEIYGNELVSDSTPVLSMKRPRWHSSIAGAFPITQPALFKDSVVELNPSRFAIVRTDKNYSKNDIESTNSCYAMIDPTQTSRVVLRSSGIWKILGYVGEGRVVVDTCCSQPFFTYKLTTEFGYSSARGTATAQLFDDQGNHIGPEEDEAEIEVIDRMRLMENQSSGDEGICYLTGNEFHAIQAAC